MSQKQLHFTVTIFTCLTMTSSLNENTSKNSSSIPNSNTSPDLPSLLIYILASLCFTVIIVISLMWLRRYRFLMQTITDLKQAGEVLPKSYKSARPGDLQNHSVPGQHLSERIETELKGPSFNREDLVMLQHIGAGHQKNLYKARLAQGVINGHSLFICKIYTKGAKQKQVQKEIAILQKLSSHKNLLQLLEWDVVETPFMLILEYAEYGNLHRFLKFNKDRLRGDLELHQKFTIAAYHIAHAMNYLHSSRMILHCNLTLKNIMVHKFPSEVKVTEFGLAKDMLSTSTCSKTNRMKVPIRWYPPEYFKNNSYGFKGDVWAFGILIWEMQSFGTLPYTNLKTSEKIVDYVCAGHRNPDPEECRPEMLLLMKNCWEDLNLKRPSFMDIVKVLEDILENDCDYLHVKPCSST